MTLYRVPFHTVVRTVERGWLEIEADSPGEAVSSALESDPSKGQGMETVEESLDAFEVHAGLITVIPPEIPSPAADIDSHSIE